jgi:hypothetical protein
LRFPFIGISPLNDVENHRKAEKSKLTLLMWCEFYSATIFPGLVFSTQIWLK